MLTVQFKDFIQEEYFKIEAISWGKEVR
jgi:hypothetical protein